MRKHLFLFSITLLLFINSFSQVQFLIFPTPDNPAEVIMQAGIVKEMFYKYEFDGKKIKDSSLIAEFYYDDLGKLTTEKIPSGTSGFKERRISYYYDSIGQLTKKVTIELPYKEYSFVDYEYDSAGNEINKYSYTLDTTYVTIEHKTYNKNKQVTELYTKLPNSKMYLYCKYYYADDNSLQRANYFHDNGGLTYAYLYEYDKRSNKKTTYIENDAGKELEEEDFYNPYGLCVKKNTFVKQNGRLTYVYQEEREVNGKILTRTTDQVPVNQIRLITQKTVNSFNPDKTLFETDVFFGDRKVQMFRHYYFKN